MQQDIEMPVREKRESSKRRAMIFELDTVAFGGREAYFKVLKGALNDKGVKLTPTLFSRYCLHPSPMHFLGDLFDAVGKKKTSLEKIAAVVNRGYEAALTGDGVKLDSSLAKLIADNPEVPLGALAPFDEETAREVASKLGLADGRVALLAYQADGRGAARADNFLKLAKKLGVAPLHCTAVVTSSPACKAALAAGMRCASVPDQYTDYQDFSGSDIVLDELAGASMNQILGVEGSQG